MDRSTMDRRDFIKSAMALTAAATASAAMPLGASADATSAASLEFASAREAARAIRSGAISSVELTRHMLSRIEKHNPGINAIVTITEDRALEAARAADAAAARGEWWGPFHGVPITIKDTILTEGTLTTAGSKIYEDYVPAEDASVVARIKRAGAVILGKTNVPEWAQDVQTYNEVFGTTNNPWDKSRTCGGSTGGGAAALAAGLTYLSVGSDIGGSIRTPANFCGVYGHKPTYGVVSRHGGLYQPPDRLPAWENFLSVNGPLARNAVDLATAMDVLGGPDAPESLAFDWQMPPARGRRLSDYRIGYVLDDPRCPVVDATKARLEAAVEALAKAGATVVEGWPEGVDPQAQRSNYEYLLMVAFAEQLDEEQTRRMKSATGGPDNLLTNRARAWTDPHYDVDVQYRRRLVHQAAWDDYFRTHDAFLTPVTFVPAFPHVHTPIEFRTLETPDGKRLYIDLFFWISFATMTGAPATSAPVGPTPDGLPVGIQIMGPRYEDATPIDIAGLLADQIGGFQTPPGYAG